LEFERGLREEKCVLDGLIYQNPLKSIHGGFTECSLKFAREINGKGRIEGSYRVVEKNMGIFA
jgi:hypothetical protein